jgi:choline dehydrogenase-like flavoprotein
MTAKHVVVVGSGASGVHFARVALDNGWRVTMLDVGRAALPPVAPDASFARLKRELDDPAEYFLGRSFEGVLFPGHRGEYYGFPPHKGYIFQALEPFRWSSRGFDPLLSFARGGLAEAWTGGAFPFTAAEMADFPLDHADFAPHYGRIAREIGVSGASDDLARFLPVHEHLAPALELDEHSCRLLERYARVRERLNRDLRVFVGRSRAATRADDRDGRNGCTYLGRCLWGCPREALYTPSITLRALRARDGFSYLDGRFATRIDVGESNRVRAVRAIELATGREEVHESERIVLAAGTLASSKLFLSSLRRIAGRAPELGGLMDNRQVLVPFVNLSMLRRRYDPDTYQYHQLALGLERADPRHYVHGLVTTLKTALIHPIVQSVPFDLRSALSIFRDSHAALGILNVNFHDERRERCSVALEGDGDGERLLVRYEPAPAEPERIRSTLATLRSALRRLGCVVPPGMTHVRPMGASVHYAGTLPMSAAARPLSTTPECESRDLKGLYLADGSTFPFLPAKNLTFSLMANSARVAELAFPR